MCMTCTPCPCPSTSNTRPHKYCCGLVRVQPALDPMASNLVALRAVVGHEAEREARKAVRIAAKQEQLEADRKLLGGAAASSDEAAPSAAANPEEAGGVAEGDGRDE